MKTDLDIVMVATRLVEELGDDAVRLAKVKLVELIAANNLRAAAFWREVMRLCEEHTGATAPPPTGIAQPRADTVDTAKFAAH
ncbi:MAG TPA: hypothetical protein VEX87_06460 [Skermanella sp.]|jgi:hypothetical protein|nr:hypothetical protein [Skermanella sp.]